MLKVGEFMNIFNRLKNNGLVILTSFLSVWGVLSAIASFVLIFVSWDDIGITDLSHKIYLLVGVLVVALFIAVLTVFVRNKKTIFGYIDKGLIIEYGDVINLGFDNCGKSKKIIIIPVNRCFDLNCENNLIAEKSIHGQWINKYIRSEDHRDKVHQDIEDFLAHQNVEYIDVEEKDKQYGYLKRYAPGTIVELNAPNDITFYLWGVSEFDSDLKANCSELDYYKSLQKLVDYYDAHGQCVDLYCPVVGDHIIRPTKPTEDILHFMISIFKINKSRIHGKIHIVVYNTKKADIPILKY